MALVVDVAALITNSFMDNKYKSFVFTAIAILTFPLVWIPLLGATGLVKVTSILEVPSFYEAAFIISALISIVFLILSIVISIKQIRKREHLGLAILGLILPVVIILLAVVLTFFPLSLLIFDPNFSL